MDSRPAPSAAPAPTGLPARVLVDDDLRRSRLTVFFRFFLALPHLVFLALWSVMAVLIAGFNWFAILFTGRAVAHDLQARYVRYFAHVVAYLNLAANPFPGFAGEPGYAVDVEVAPGDRQSRLKTALRLVLAIPALLLASMFGPSLGSGYFTLIAAAAFLAWFAALALGRMPQGLRDLIAYANGYLAQAGAYTLLLTDHYPSSDPLAARYGAPAPEHPVTITAEGSELRRSRLTVFFRFFLALPHLVWAFLWSIAVWLAVAANWFVTLARGRPAAPLHRFTARFLRYWIHLTAYLYLVANPFPGFAGRPGSYPINVSLPEPGRQSRWITAFRAILAIPAMIVWSALANALGLVALLGWFTGVFAGRMPVGLRNLGVFALRYQAQLGAYLLLLTDRYPYSGPSLELPREREASKPG